MPRWTSLLVLVALALVGAAEAAWADVPVTAATEVVVESSPATDGSSAEEATVAYGDASARLDILAGGAAHPAVQATDPSGPPTRPPRV